MAAFSTAIRGLLAPRLPAVASRCPGLRLAITEHDPDQAVHAITAGAAELAIIHDADGLPPPVPTPLTERYCTPTSATRRRTARTTSRPQAPSPAATSPVTPG